MKDLNIEVSEIAIINEFSSENEKFQFSHSKRKWYGFVYFTEGKGVFTLSTGEKYEIKSSTLILLSLNDSYSFSIEAGYRYIASAYMLSDKDNSLELLPRVCYCSEAEDLIVSSIYKSWQQHKVYSPLSCKIHILSLYLELFKKYSLNTHSDAVITLATDFIHSNFDRNFSTGEIALHCKTSQSHLRSKFRSALGMTITEYRESLRIEEAKRMLSSSIFSNTEIAYKLGYSDLYHFTKAFKKRVGISPGKYARLDRP